MSIDDIPDDVFARDWEQAFPEEAEYQAWIASLENDLKKQGLTVTPKTRFFDEDSFDPFNTVNS